jgi:putative ATP-dependent endonuclease of OLD family
MRIKWLRIKGFRNFDDEVINFNDKTLIIGGNDVGKTNMIYALRIILDKSLSLRDLELNDNDYNAYTKASEIEITLKLSDITEDCLKSVFTGDIENGSVIIQYKNSKSGEVNILTGPTEDLLELKNSRFYLKRLNLEYVDTNRDLFKFIKRERQNILSISKELLKKEQADQDEKSLKVIQDDLDTLNNNVDNLNYIKSSLDKVNTELSSLAIHNEDQKVKFVTCSSDVGELLDNLELSYSDDGSMLKIGGDGRNNQIFLATWIAKQKIERTQERVTIFAIEEPEAHLHPHQQRKLSKYLIESFEDQIFITTHSPQIASEFKPDGIVRLYSKNKITKVAQGGCSKDIALTFDDFGYRLNVISSETFFSNAVLLVEGSSEILFYKALAAALRIDLDRLNVSILSVEGVGFKPYIKICKALEIPFVMRTDDDIFSKTKKGEEYYYFAGISRVIGIYNKLISKSKDDELVKYWKNNKEKNEWQGDRSDWTDETTDLNNYIRGKLDKYNIFLAWDNLEQDLVESKLFKSLSEFYDEEDKGKLLEMMQKRKAENMLEYLEESLDDLKILKADDIAKPLLRVEKIVKKVVSKHVKETGTK